jgi:hypothetical protein
MTLIKKIVLAGLMALPLQAVAAEAPAKLYKNPNCACCDEYADYLRKNGFEVEVINTHDLAQIKAKENVPEHLYGCHTMTVGRYVFEGLVPLESINKLLEERPFIKGLSLPGMPMGAPGMPGRKAGPLEVYTLGFGEGAKTHVYATH